LRSIDFVQDCPQLISLNVASASFKTIPRLDRLKNLKNLSLMRVPIVNLDILSKLKTLKSLSVCTLNPEKTDFSPILKCRRKISIDLLTAEIPGNLKKRLIKRFHLRDRQFASPERLRELYDGHLRSSWFYWQVSKKDCLIGWWW
jgi:hypothetical protein